MAKNKKDDELDLSGIVQKYGGEVLSNTSGVKYFIDTGNLAVNWVCSGKFMGGGLPGGRIVEFQGPSSGGKSLWASNIARGFQSLGGIVIYLDCENAVNPIFMERTSHVDATKLIRFGPKDGIDCLEGVFSKIYNLINAIRAKYPKKPILFIYDSIAVSPSRRELNEVDLPEEYTDAQFKRIVGHKEQPGERAKICNKEFRKLESIIEKQDVSMLVINQIRQKIGVRYGNPETGSTAATVLEFYSSCRLRVSAHKKIEHSELKTQIGTNLKIKNIKNRTCNPYQQAEDLQLFFQEGINPLSGLVVALKQAERIELTGKATWKIKEPYAGGQDITFKATETKNIMPENVLLSCPALIDAKDEEEVRAYLNIFRNSIDFGNDDTKIKEIDIENPDEE